MLYSQCDSLSLTSNLPVSEQRTETTEPNQPAALLNAGYRYALSLTTDSGDAEDLVHDAWLRLVGRYGTTPDKPLLFRTIRNLFIDNYRRNRRIEHHHKTIASIDGYQTDHIDESIADSQLLDKHLKMLRHVEREALFLSVVEGYTAEEIANINDCSRGTVLSLLHRAKRKLAASLSKSQEYERQSTSPHSRSSVSCVTASESTNTRDNNVLSLNQVRQRK